jgi:predicted dehydrogenase
MPARVRIGVIGAGNFTTGRLLPDFQALPDVEVTAVANRRRESAERVAAQFGIPRVAADYHELLAGDDVDAVLIGTPPYLHKEATLAALDAGKHVLCETRISTSAEEAREMHEHAVRAQVRGVRSMLIPPFPWSRGSKFVSHLLATGFLGSLRQVQAFNVNASFADPNTPLSGSRFDLDLYGRFNAGQLGLTYDVMTRWTGYATSLVAQRATFVPERPLTPEGPLAPNPYPDAVCVLAETESGAVGLNLLNYAAYFADGRIELYGSEGTVIYRQRGDEILTGRKGDDSLQPAPIPPQHDNRWTVEEEFLRLVRGEIDEPSFTFWNGVKNLEYLEAAYYAATEGRRVTLP